MSSITPTMEDYLECIYLLTEQKGYARVSDISEALEIQRPAVTKMVQKLDQKKYLVYEKYRGLILTTKGKKLGGRLVYRHELLERFLEIIGVNSGNIFQDVEGIEHHLSWDSIERIGDLVEYFDENVERIHKLREIQHEENDQ